MPVTAGHEVVLNGSTVIGDDDLQLETRFRTGGRVAHEPALLTMMVRGLSDASARVSVRINDTVVGHIQPLRRPTNDAGQVVAGRWLAQHFAFEGAVLSSNRANELHVEASGSPGAIGADLLDDLAIRDVVCFYRQVC